MAETSAQRNNRIQKTIAEQNAYYANRPSVSTQAGATLAGIYNGGKSNLEFLGRTAANIFPGLAKDSQQFAENWKNDTVLSEDLRNYKGFLEETQPAIVNGAETLYNVYAGAKVLGSGAASLNTGKQTVMSSRFWPKSGQFNLNLNRPPRRGQLGRDLRSLLGDFAL